MGAIGDFLPLGVMGSGLQLGGWVRPEAGKSN